jgi:prepilin signal peptidase PulO-like enzyme (type II secretory pathway)
MSFGLLAILLSLYIVITVYDIRHKVIPDFFSYSAAVIALCMIAVDSSLTGYVDFWRIIAGPALFLFFWFFWKVSRGTWMGLGDGKLALSIGWALGFSQGIAALLLSFWVGAAVSLLIMAVQALWGWKKGMGRLRMRSQIPFGPFLVIGFLIVLAWSVDIQALLAHLAV